MTTSALPLWESHSKGQGLVARDSDVSRHAYIAPAAIIRPGAEVYGKARVEGTAEIGRLARVMGKAVVRGGKILDFSCVADQAEVVGSVLSSDSGKRDCPLVCDEARVENSYLYGQVRVRENASLKNVTADGDVTIRGNARVEDCELGSGVIIHEGLWTISPRVWLTGCHYNVIECVPNPDPMQVHVIGGCHCMTVERWVTGGRRYGRAMGLTDDQMEIFAELIIENFVPEEFKAESYAKW